MRYAVGCDHAGFPLKEPLVAELEAQGHDVLDLGTSGFAAVDYPVLAFKVAQTIVSGRADMGLLICGTGLGMAITANKVEGIRAVSVSDAFSARMARAHNDANVLCVGARVVGPGMAVDILRAWLGTEFEGGRHQRRVEMIMDAAGCMEQAFGE